MNYTIQGLIHLLRMVFTSPYFFNAYLIAEFFQQLNSGVVFKGSGPVAGKVNPEVRLGTGSGQVGITFHEFFYGSFNSHKAKVIKKVTKSNK
jgi:hypothetical protein